MASSVMPLIMLVLARSHPPQKGFDIATDLAGGCVVRLVRQAIPKICVPRTKKHTSKDGEHSTGA